MINKVKLITLLTLLMILLISGVYMCLVILYNKNMITDISIEKYEPFSDNNILKKNEGYINFQGDLPKIEAASAFYPFSANLVQSLCEEKLYSEELLQIVSTAEAFNDIISGNTDIIISTGPSDEQKELIKNSGISLEYKELYLEPLVMFVNKKSNIDNLNIEQIKDIYYGDKYDFNTYQLEKNNGSQTCFESIVKNNKIGENHYEIDTMPKIIDRVGLDKKGIGYAFNSYYSKMHINKNTKLIKVNNKEINEKDYPLVFNVYLIYRSDNNNENISKIVKWLNSKEAKELICKIK